MTLIHSVTAVLLKANISVICQNCQALTRTFHFNACYLSFIKHSWENINTAMKYIFFSIFQSHCSDLEFFSFNAECKCVCIISFPSVGGALTYTMTEEKIKINCHRF